MPIPIDSGNARPSMIQEYDGFDTTTIDSNRWETPTEIGSTLITQAAGNLVFTNTGAGTKGISYLKSKRKFGKIWRISIDMFIDDFTGSIGEACLCLYKDSSNWIKMGPYKSTTNDCNCLLRVNKAGTETETLLTLDTINKTTKSTYTICILNDILIFYYNGTLMTSLPFGELTNYNIMLMAGTGANTDTITVKANDYEILNFVDTLSMTVAKIIQDVKTTVATLKIEPTVTDISGNITLTNTTEQYVTFAQATYGNKFKVNMFADLEGADMDYCYLYKSSDTSWTDQTVVANNLQSNSILLVPSTGKATNDCIYFGSSVIFHRLDVYMEEGISNVDNVFEWEGWTGAAWVSLTETDGTDNGEAFGKSGKVTWTEDLAEVAVNGTVAYWVRARLTTAGSATNNPKATHVQTSSDVATGFDSVAEFVSNLVVSIYRKRGDGSYAALPADIALPFTQCILYRNIELSNLPAWTDIKIGFKLSTAPTANAVIPYTGYIETVES